MLQPEIQHPLLASAEVAADDDEGLKGVRARPHRPHAPAYSLGRRVAGDLAQEVRSVLEEARPAERRSAAAGRNRTGAHGLLNVLLAMSAVPALAEQPDQMS